MASNRSTFYVETLPPKSSEPTQRHSMYVTPPDVEAGAMRQDLSSSSNTLPSSSGSVDRLTEKKKPKFFTLKPKGSFSLRPFFSSSSSLSPKKRGKESKRDSYVQTDEAGRAHEEVGVQTQNASTVDVPVQTSFEWAEGESLSYRQATQLQRPTFRRWPSLEYSPVSKPLDSTGSSSYVAPLAPSKLLKYAAPGPLFVSEKPPESVNNRALEKDNIVFGSVPVNTIVNKQLTDESASVNVHPKPSSPKLFRDSSLVDSAKPVPLPEEYKNTDSNKSSPVIPRSTERPPSVLKIERTDSPGKSKPKSVHFEVSKSEECLPLTTIPVPSEISLPRNLDEEFVALLRDFDILPDDYIDTSPNTGSLSETTAIPKPIKFFPSPVPSPQFPFQDHLPPIPENSAEITESVDHTNANERPLKKDENTPEHDTKISILQPNVNRVNVIEITDYPVILDSKNITDEKTDGLIKSTSSTTIEDPKLDSTIDVNRGNVYDVDIKESSGKTVELVTLPTLPSFFESTPKYTKSAFELEVVNYCSEREEPLLVATSDIEDVEEKMLSRSNSRSSLRSNPSVEFDELLDSARKFDSCENLDQLEEEIIRSLCQPDTALDDIEVNEFVPISNNQPTISSNDAMEMRRNIVDRLLSVENEENVAPKQNGKSISPPTGDSSKNRKKSKRGKKYVATITKMETDSGESDFNQNEYSSKCLPSSSFANSFANSDFPANVKVSHGTETNISCLVQEIPSLGPQDPHPTNQFKKSRSETLPNPTSNLSCDFANCLKPSMMQDSPFAAKMNVSPIMNRAAPSLPVVSDGNKAVPNQNGQCDYGNCLKPSQVHNSNFTAELSEITANKSSSFSNDSCPSNNYTTSGIRSPIPFKVGYPDPASIKRIEPPEKKSLDGSNRFQHKAEITITLGPPSKGVLNSDSKEDCTHSIQLAMSEPDSTSSLSKVSESRIPQPPPLPEKKSPILIKSNSLQMKYTSEKIPDSGSFSSEPSSPTLKSSAIFEFQPNSGGQIENNCNSGNIILTDDIHKDVIHESEGNTNENFHNNPNSPSLTSNLYQNGTNRYNSVSPDNNINKTSHQEIVLSPNAVVTDAPPPPGAVLLDQKVTVEGNKIHTDKYYALPVKEVLKETTCTTKFIPAPPKFEGIGPTEDGIPIGLRNSVKKENMHNWYKTMYKSLHKADLSNDGQEYVIGYTSDPEMSKDKMRPSKSATLDNRQVPKTNGSLYRDNYPASAKSSIEVYNVRPRLIEDYEPGYSSVTDNDNTVVSKRFLPTFNAPKPAYEFKNGYEQENHFIRNLEQPDMLSVEQQKTYYKDIQRGGDIPQFGLGKPAPEKPKDPVLGPLPSPPTAYYGPTSPKAERPLSHPINYVSPSENNNYLSSSDYEFHMKQMLHSELHQTISPSSSMLSSPGRMKSPSRSPDLKMPARALFDFKTESPKELSLRKGDFVLILRQLDKNWYEGERQGKIGIFPVSYVEIVPPEHVSTPAKVYSEGVGKVLYEFTAQTSVELSVKKGDTISLLRRVDSNWYDARLNNIRGIVPVSYVHVLQEPTEKNASLGSPKTNPASPIGRPESKESSLKSKLSQVFSGCSKQSYRGKRGVGLIVPATYKALYSYTPQNTDELELKEGDLVCVVEMCDDGWFVGTSACSGKFGIFPGNYVEEA